MGLPGHPHSPLSQRGRSQDPGEAAGVTQGPCCPWLLLGGCAGPWLPVQAVNPSVSRGGSVCHLCTAVTAERHQPTQRLAKHPRAPQDAGMVLGAVEPGTGIPRNHPCGMSPASDPVCAREGDKFGHCFPSTNIISCFFNIKARCCWKNVLPSLFFHQIISQRNIWQQLTNGLLLPVGAAAPVPHSCRGSWQMPPATTVPIIRATG